MCGIGSALGGSHRLCPRLGLSLKQTSSLANTKQQTVNAKYIQTYHMAGDKVDQISAQMQEQQEMCELRFLL